MVKIEAVTLEEAYQKAACSLKCSVTELQIEVAQVPKKGFLGFFKKSAIIVAIRVAKEETPKKPEILKKSEPLKKKNKPKVKENKDFPKAKTEKIQTPKEVKKQDKPKKKEIKKSSPKEQGYLNDTMMPISFVSTQDDEDVYDDVSNYLADYEDETDFCDESEGKGICEIVDEVQADINNLFDLTCFKIQSIEVSVFDEETLLIEFKGEDVALLIGKEGYRYKALSYMLFNWLNTKYQVQLRLEIAEFLKNQEDAIEKYLVGVYANIEKDGRAKTKILDGVLIQIALSELRNKYPNKYIAIGSTRDGLKYIIVNDYHNK